MKSRWIALVLFALAARISGQDYKTALPGHRFEFPRDFFNHEAYQTEWWYYTGNLKAPDGHRFGFELTFFRQGVSRAPSDNPWFVHDLWMAHMALSDIDGQRFRHEERLNRSGPGLAGVNAPAGVVWNGNWQAHITDREEDLRGIAQGFGFALKLIPAKSPVLHGVDGYSQKGEGIGHASQYFSLTRLVTSGSIEVDGKTYQVQGNSWMDHEFFTGSMAGNETGWDWLSVQLDGGAELMLYRLRHQDGSIDPYSSGTYVDAHGATRHLSAKDFAMAPTGEMWTSPETGASYPLRWHVSIPASKMEFDVTTPLRNQEMTSRVGPSYWEGAVDVAGTSTGSVVRGVGYLEMTGYAHPGTQVIPR